jgi:SMC interacting uncharacterized protein involved in chromosome segregation
LEKSNARDSKGPGKEFSRTKTTKMCLQCMPNARQNARAIFVRKFRHEKTRGNLVPAGHGTIGFSRAV